jgi:hypothetical protein
LRLDFFVAPGGFLGNEHLHPKQEERIEVLSAHCAAASVVVSEPSVLQTP